MTRKHLLIFLPLIFIILTVYVVAQVTTGTISGIVRDQSEAALPRATVTLVHLATGTTRALVTDDEGRYIAPNLPLGDYQLTARLAGFKAAVRRGITLTVGQEAVVDLTLSVGDIVEEVVVTQSAPTVETTSSAISGLVDAGQIRDLPLNGRDYLQLAILQPGVNFYAVGTQSQSTGMGLHIAVSGARPNQNQYLLDGTDINDVSNFSPGSALGVALGTEAIREFRVLSNTFSAEYGRAGGGVISAVTRSGTNEFHGSIFEFHRNDYMDARNFFDGEDTPEFKRNQFGFSAGGPIVKDRTFFFGTYEGVRQGLGQTKLATVPDENARQGLLPDPSNPGQLIDVGVAPEIRAYLDLYPLPNGRNFGGGIAEFINTSTRITEEDYFLIRIDHRLSDSDSLTVRYTFADSFDDDPQTVPIFETNRTVRYQYTLFEEQHIFSPNLLNVFRFAYNRSSSGQLFTELVPLDPELNFRPDRTQLGDIDVAGLSTYGAGSLIRFFNFGTFQGTNNVSYTRGAHSIKAGFNIERFHNNQDNTFAVNGITSFTSLRNFLGAQPIFTLMTVPGFDAIRGWRQSLFGFYIQDDYKATPNLSLNLGLRYEFITSPTEVNDKSATLVHPLQDPETTVGDVFYRNPSLDNFAPRLGFAWDPFGDGKTAIRGGFGLYYNQLLSDVYLFAGVRNPPFFVNAGQLFPTFPDPFVQGIPASAASIEAVQFFPNQPYVMQYNLNIQREVAPDTRFQIGYVGSRGVHLIRLAEGFNNKENAAQIVNGRKFFPEGGGRNNPAFSSIRMRLTDGNSSYNSLQLGVNKRSSRGFRFQVNYTLSKLMDDGSITVAAGTRGGGDSTNAVGEQDPFDREADLGLSNFDVRHNLVFNYTVDLPFGPGRRFGSGWSGFAGKFAQGWQISGITTAASGNPFTVRIGFDNARSISFRGGGGLRPDLAPGANNNPIRENNPDQYFDPTNFLLPEAGFFGNLGRNTLIGPGLVNFDFAIVKRTSLLGERSLEFRAEFFNIFNRANFELPPNIELFTPDGSSIPSAGRIVNTVTTSRQIQFGLKFVF